MTHVILEQPQGEIPAEVVCLLLCGVAPERSTEFSTYFSHHSPRFFVSDFARRYGGFCALDDKNHVLLAPNATDALWFLSFAAWHGFRARVPQEVLASILPSGKARDEVLLLEDDGYHSEATVCHDLTALAKKLMLGTVPSDTPWPDSVPFPADVINAQDDQTAHIPVEAAAVKDLSLFAIAYILLHEIRHIGFNSERAGLARAQEELACDEFAIDQILGRAATWLPTNGSVVSPEQIIFKRSMGLLVGFFALHGLTPNGLRGPQRNYPPLSERLIAIVDRIALPDDHQLWLFGSTLLRELQDDSDYAVLATDNSLTTKANFLLLANRGFY